jgi:integration host factor subunit beta
MTRSELISQVADKLHELPREDVDEATRIIFETILANLEKEQRIEIRGFGSFSVRCYKPRKARNPKTGEQVELEETFSTHFKPGKELREAVNASIAAA